MNPLEAKAPTVHYCRGFCYLMITPDLNNALIFSFSASVHGIPFNMISSAVVNPLQDPIVLDTRSGMPFSMLYLVE